VRRRDLTELGLDGWRGQIIDFFGGRKIGPGGGSFPQGDSSLQGDGLEPSQHTQATLGTVKRFSLSQQREAALEVMETFRVLSPNSTRLFNWQGRLTQGDYAVFRGIADAIKLGLNKMAEALSRNSNRKIVVAFCFHFPAAACSLSVGSFNLHRFGRFRCRI
jgi:hypothetical protein